jgi:hypothetical protein
VSAHYEIEIFEAREWRPVRECASGRDATLLDLGFNWNGVTAKLAFATQRHAEKFADRAAVEHRNWLTRSMLRIVEVTPPQAETRKVVA